MNSGLDLNFDYLTSSNNMSCSFKTNEFIGDYIFNTTYIDSNLTMFLFSGISNGHSLVGIMLCSTFGSIDIDECSYEVITDENEETFEDGDYPDIDESLSEMYINGGEYYEEI